MKERNETGQATTPLPEQQCNQARPHKELIEELLDSRRLKTEREHAAAAEIEWLHGLRMLNPDVFSRLPFASADSTNIAQNVGIDSAWRGTYTPASKECRALVMRERIESHQATTFWERQRVQMVLAA